MTEEAVGLFRDLAAPPPPDLSPRELADLYLLRRHLGIEPEDAYYRRSPWVIDLLAEGVRTELGLSTEDEQAPARPEADWAAFDELEALIE